MKDSKAYDIRLHEIVKLSSYSQIEKGWEVCYIKEKKEKHFRFWCDVKEDNRKWYRAIEAALFPNDNDQFKELKKYLIELENSDQIEINNLSFENDLCKRSFFDT